MDYTKRINDPKTIHTRDKANFLSHLFFCWELGMIMENRRNALNEDDIKTPPQELDSTILANKLEKCWQKEVNSSKEPSLVRVIARAFGTEFFLYGLLTLLGHILTCVGLPFLLQKLLTFDSSNKKLAAYHGIAIVAVYFVYMFVFHFNLFQVSVLGVKIRVACSSLIYKKLLMMKKSGIEKITLGRIVNLLSNDVERFDKRLTYISYIWITPIVIILGTYILWRLFNYSAVTGIVITLPYYLSQLFLSKKISSTIRVVASKTDYRIRLMSNIINGIPAIKMYTWEKPFAKVIDKARRLELSNIEVVNHLHSFAVTCTVYSYRISVFLCVIVASFCGFPLTPQYVYTLINFYDHLAIYMYMAVRGFNVTAEIKISIKRIQEFLSFDTKSRDVYIERRNSWQSNYSIFLKNVSAKWDPSNEVLSNVSLTATSGELVGIAGSAGSGKSALLQVILGDLEVSKGIFHTDGTISYAPQEPWIFPGTIRQNILFGEELDENRYLQVIKVCALEHDLSLFPYGDNSLVGERGIMLSGGQKSRINLARSVYRNADIYLLDDPLSAVDRNVANTIFKECFLDYLKKKCVILVTHQLKHLTKIYLLEKGKTTEIKPEDCENFAPPNEERKTSFQFDENHLPLETKEDAGNEMTKSYKNYFLSGNSITSNCCLLFFFIFILLLCCFMDVFLAFWLNSIQNRSDFLSDQNCLYLYGTLLMTLVVMYHLAIWLFIKFCKKSSRHLHDSLLSKLLLGPLNFFNNHSSGRILNRFSKDIGIIDGYIPPYLQIILRNGLCIFTAALLVAITNYSMILPTIVVFIPFYFIQKLFQPFLSKLRRIESTRRSPLFTQVVASVQGLNVIKTSNSQSLLQQEFNLFQNIHSSADYLHNSMFHSLGFWIDFVGILYAGTIIFISIFSEAGNKGLAITQSLMFMVYVQHGVKTIGDLDSQMTSVARVGEYKDLTVERDEGILKPSQEWPSKGKIVFDSVSMRYSPESNLVLNNLCITIQGGEKIGIIGRTGAGKTSLISILFRLYDFQGTILIDDVDTNLVPLKSLRSKMLIIPQDPVLFLDTLRKNLDPFDEFIDSELWNALGVVSLTETVSGLSSGLETMVSEGGSNFSVGEKQLLCLVRAILRNAKIIVLDEATANVDLETDKLIQSTIREKFGNSTVLTIAHRIHTVRNSDKILVMDSGAVVDFGPPEELLKDCNSYFYKTLELI